MSVCRNFYFAARPIIVLLLAFAALSAASLTSRASDIAVKEFQRAAYAGDFAVGIAKLKEIAAANPDDAEAIFGRGTLEVFNAIATFQKGLYDHANYVVTPSRRPGLAMALLPFMTAVSGAMFVPPNPNAEPMTYKALRGLLERLADDLVVAEKTLASVGDRAAKIPIQPFRIAIDLNHDGQIGEYERLMSTMLGGQRRRLRDGAFIVTLVFDTADASWLRGYTNLMLASVNFLLAFDFEESYETSAHNLFGASATELGRELERQLATGRSRDLIDADIAKIDAEIRELGRSPQVWRQIRVLRQQRHGLAKTPESEAQRKELQDKIDELLNDQRRFSQRMTGLRSEKRALMAERDGFEYAPILDLIAFIHSLNWKVIEPERLRASRRHLVSVMQINSNTWRLVRAETDDDREWLPNPRQTPPFGANRITDEVIDGWLATTALAGEVLEGHKLVPHPRFRKGFNLRRLFDTTTQLDFIRLSSGHDLIPYLEDGEIADEKSWRNVTDALGNNFATYAFWFN